MFHITLIIVSLTHHVPLLPPCMPTSQVSHAFNGRFFPLFRPLAIQGFFVIYPGNYPTCVQRRLLSLGCAHVPLKFSRPNPILDLKNTRERSGFFLFSNASFPPDVWEILFRETQKIRCETIRRILCFFIFRLCSPGVFPRRVSPVSFPALLSFLGVTQHGLY